MKKLWIDDTQPAPDGCRWCKTVTEAREYITVSERQFNSFIEKGLYFSDFIINTIDINHNIHECVNFLEWIKTTNRKQYLIILH